jgi:hypothetical protein
MRLHSPAGPETLGHLGVVGYVYNGVLPAKGAVCVQQDEPFPASDD